MKKQNKKQVNKKTPDRMFDIHWRVSKFNEDKRLFLYLKTILTIIMRQGLQGKN